jgi:hypothetical protein
VGEVRNTNTELAASVTPIENALVRWTVGGNFSHNDSKVLRLDPSKGRLVNAGSGDITDARVAVGYPLFGRWAKPILGYGDENGDGIIQSREIRLGDTAVYLGRENPGVIAALNTDLSLFRGRLGVHASFIHQGAYTQLNRGSGSDQTFLSAANDSNATFGQQAAYVAVGGPFTTTPVLTEIGLAQPVSYWRFESLSLNYNVPTAVAQRFRVPRMSVALQGSNLKLWSNYRGKDPNVNAFPNGNQTADGGQLPQPRTWSVQFTLGN